MELLVLPDARFTCSTCTNCCRDWHVELLDDEIVATEKLPWPAGDEMHGRQATFRHGGKTFLAHRRDGSCVFLNLTNGLCRIHETFGSVQKPLGCKLYPFQIVPLDSAEASVTARFDCPAVRKNSGLPHAEALPELKRYKRRLTLPDPFDAGTLSGFTLEQVNMVCEFAGILLDGFATDHERAMFLLALCDELIEFNPEELDRESLSARFPAIKNRIKQQAKDWPRRPGFFTRIAFRTLLGMYLRRDEDVLNGFATRSGRVLGMVRIVLGTGRLRLLGRSHPTARIRAVGLLHRPTPASAADAFDSFWRMIRDKLASLQFMGSANPGHDFVRGLRSLALLYLLVHSFARCVAVQQKRMVITSADVDLAVGAVEHAFGRSPILSQSMTRSLEQLLGRPETFVRLAHYG